MANFSWTAKISPVFDDAALDRLSTELNQTLTDASKITNTDQQFKYLSETQGTSGIPQTNPFQNLITAITQIRSAFTSLGNSLTGNFSYSLQHATKTVKEIDNIFQKNAGKALSQNQVNDLMTKSSSLVQTRMMLDAFRKNMGQDIGWSFDVFKQKVPILMSQIINPQMKKLNEGTFIRSGANFDRYSFFTTFSKLCIHIIPSFPNLRNIIPLIPVA